MVVALTDREGGFPKRGFPNDRGCGAAADGGVSCSGWARFGMASISASRSAPSPPASDAMHEFSRRALSKKKPFVYGVDGGRSFEAVAFAAPG